MTAPTMSLAGLIGCRIAVAESPVTRESRAEDTGRALARALSEVGATAVRVPTYRDDHPLSAAARRVAHRTAGGQVDAVVFADAVAATSWLATMERLGLLGAVLRREVSSRLILSTRDAEIRVPLVAAGLQPRMAAHPTVEGQIAAVVAYFEEEAPSIRTNEGFVEVRSGGVFVDRRFLPLSRGAAGVMEALFLARGRVLTRAEIGRVLAGRERSARAVEVAVARLRESLDGLDLVQTVVKRGYRLAVGDE